jgi:lysophospholipase L1-like esterase
MRIDQLAPYQIPSNLADVVFQLAGQVRQTAIEMAPSNLPVGRVFIPNSLYTAGSSGTSRWRHAVPSSYNYRINGVRLLYVNWFMTTTSESPGANSISLRCAVDDGTSVFPLFFGGQRVVTIDPGGFALSDYRAVDIAPGGALFSRTYVSASSTTSQFPCTTTPVTIASLGEGNTYAVGGTDLTDVGASAVTTASATAYGPAAVIGFSGPVLTNLIAGLGDSFIRGSGDTTGDSNGNTGYFCRWIGSRMGYMNLGVGSFRANYMSILARRTLQLSIMRTCGVTHVLVHYGINDITAGRTDTQIRNDLTVLGNAIVALGMRPYIATLPPDTTSSDGWTSLSGQFPIAGEPVRVAQNTWRRSVPAPFRGCLDVARIVESPVNAAGYTVSASGLWRVNLTSDGLHPNTSGASLISTNLPSPEDFFS